MEKILVVTDIVDSTALTYELGDERMAAVWIRHDEIARSLLKKTNGLEIDRTDGFLLLFQNIFDALNFSQELHSAFDQLSKEESIDFRARIGIHSGDVILLDVTEGSKKIEVEGIAKPTAARIMSIARGGQTLLSAEARFAMQSTGKFRIQSHGLWHLKGIAEPVELFEAGPSDLEFIPPDDSDKAYRVHKLSGVYVPVKEMEYYLPAERDAFIGRQRDLIDLKRRIDEGARLITILGTGGIGKSRLAVHFGWRWLGEYTGGAWYCSLSEARSLEGVVGAVSSTIGLRLGNEDPAEKIGNAIIGRGRCLMILDNFEQVADLATQTLEVWLDKAPLATFIVTSRSVLDVKGEQIHQLLPMDPDTEAVELFLARARSRNRDFEVTDRNKKDIRDIVTILDGVPLAIELAAARSRLLSPAQIKERLSNRFQLLAGMHGLEKRHQTLKATIDWSWDLLENWERSALAQCSVFAGGFTLEAAESILDMSAFESAPMTMDIIQSLIEKSLIRVHELRADIEEPWYGMFISIHEYCAEKLRTTGAFPGSGAPFEQDTWLRHSSHYSRLGSDGYIDTLRGEAGLKRRWNLSEELDNLLAGANRSILLGQGDVSSLLLSAAWIVLRLEGPAAAIKKPAERLLLINDLSELAKLRVMEILAGFERISSNLEAAWDWVEKGLSLARELSNKRIEASLLNIKGVLLRTANQPDAAREAYLEALTLARELRHSALESTTLNSLGILHAYLGKYAESKAYYHKAAELAARDQDLMSEGMILNNLAVIQNNQGEYKAAKPNFERALEISRLVRNRHSECNILGNLSSVNFNLGSDVKALEDLKTAIDISKSIGDVATQGKLTILLADNLMDMGRYPEAEELLVSARELLVRGGVRREEAHCLSGLGMIHFFKGNYDRALPYMKGAIEICRETKHRGKLASALQELALVYTALEKFDDAIGALDEASALSDELGLTDIYGSILGTYGKVYTALHAFDRADAYFAKGAQILRELDLKHPHLRLLIDYAVNKCKAGDLEGAEELIGKASKQFEQLYFTEESMVTKDLEKAIGLVRGESRIKPS